MTRSVRITVLSAAASSVQQVSLYFLASPAIYAVVQLIVVSAEVATGISCVGVLQRFLVHHSRQSRYWSSVLALSASVHLVVSAAVALSFPPFITGSPPVLALGVVVIVLSAPLSMLVSAADASTRNERALLGDALLIGVQAITLAGMALADIAAPTAYLAVLAVAVTARIAVAARLVGVTRGRAKDLTVSRLRRAARMLRMTLLQKALSVFGNRGETLVVGSLLGPEIFGLYSMASSLANFITSRANALMFRLGIISAAATGRSRATGAAAIAVYVRWAVPLAAILMIATYLGASSLGLVFTHSSEARFVFAQILVALGVASCARLIGGIIGPLVVVYRLEARTVLWSAVMVLAPLISLGAIRMSLPVGTAVAMSAGFYCLMMPVGFHWLCAHLVDRHSLTALWAGSLVACVLITASLWWLPTWYVQRLLGG